MIESKEAAGFDDMYWLSLVVPGLFCAITAATVYVQNLSDCAPVACDS